MQWRYLERDQEIQGHVSFPPCVDAHHSASAKWNAVFDIGKRLAILHHLASSKSTNWNGIWVVATNVIYKQQRVRTLGRLSGPPRIPSFEFPRSGA